MYCNFKIKSSCRHETRYKKACGWIRSVFCAVRQEAERVRLHKVAIVREGFARKLGLKGLMRF